MGRALAYDRGTTNRSTRTSAAERTPLIVSLSVVPLGSSLLHSAFCTVHSALETASLARWRERVGAFRDTSRDFIRPKHNLCHV